MGHDPIAGPDMDASVWIGQQRRWSAQLAIKQCYRQNEGQRREIRNPAKAGICIYSLDVTYIRVRDHFSHLSFATPENQLSHSEAKRHRQGNEHLAQSFTLRPYQN